MTIALDGANAVDVKSHLWKQIVSHVQSCLVTSPQRNLVAVLDIVKEKDPITSRQGKNWGEWTTSFISSSDSKRQQPRQMEISWCAQIESPLDTYCRSVCQFSLS